MESTKQLESFDDEIKKVLENGELELEDDVCDENPSDRIGFDIDIINAYAEHTFPDSKEFANGVLEASKYIGQFAALINAGMDNETAIVVMSWLREDKLNMDNINGQIELAKQESIKIKRESL